MISFTSRIVRGFQFVKNRSVQCFCRSGFKWDICWSWTLNGMMYISASVCCISPQLSAFIVLHSAWSKGGACHSEITRNETSLWSFTYKTPSHGHACRYPYPWPELRPNMSKCITKIHPTLYCTRTQELYSAVGLWYITVYEICFLLVFLESDNREHASRSSDQ